MGETYEIFDRRIQNFWRDRMGGCELHSSGPEQGPVTDCYEHGNEPSGSVRCEEILDLLTNR